MTNEDDVRKRLDILIRLLLEQQLQEGKMKRNDQLILLDSIGLTTREISKILGWKSKDIASQLNTLRKKIEKSKKTTRGQKENGKK